MTNCIDIAKVGAGGGAAEPAAFVWKQNTYKLLVDIDIRALFKDVKNVDAFEIAVRPDGSLWLTLTPQLLQNDSKSRRYLRSLRDLIETFFVVERENLFDDVDDIEPQPTNDDGKADHGPAEADAGMPANADDFDDHNLPATFFDELYQKLRDEHERNGYVGHSYSDEYVQHTDMRPALTQYQKEGIKWMLNRENGRRFYPTEFKPISMRWLRDGAYAFYYNSRTIQLQINRNEDICIPSGGILADAMGLGKTVEMLSLILLNQRAPTNPPPPSATAIDWPAMGETDADEVTIRCLCPLKTIKSLVRCNECLLYQHRQCVAQSDGAATPDRLYYCPYCWKHREPLRVKTTFIVSPASIKMQWFDEIVKHVATTDFRVFVYDGMKNSKTKWISPYELGSYDIVLTDYNTLQTEFYYTDPNPSDRKLRHPSRFISARSPLLTAHWWRICLDEAQMASSVISNPAKMVAKLGAEHRWAVTGTPIQKSMDDLYGLVAFLNCAPYADRDKWRDVLNEFYCRVDVRPIIGVLEPIMWRTCKSKAIMSQINIPEQSELVHFIKLSDIEYFHYNAEHAKCWDAFYNNACKYDTTSRLAEFNPHVFKIVLEPLRKLRQDCSVPRAAELSGKRTMQQDELLKHLLKNAENDAKSELRSVASSLNGMAALHIIKENPAEAAKLYRRVLQWANEYNDRIAVDSLLQIHAIHNLLAIAAIISPDDRQQLSATMNRLESKFLHKTVNLINNYQLELNKCQDKAAHINDEFRVNAYQWWLDVLYDEIENPTTLQKKIDVDIASSYDRIKWDRIRETYSSLRSISLVLTTWLDDVLAKRDELMHTFATLRTYSEHFKPLAEVDDKVRDKLTKFLDQAYTCHLFAIRANGQPRTNAAKRAKVSLCLLCESKRSLDAYEALIYNKDLVDNEDTVYGGVSKGSWKAPHQERTLEIIASHMRLKGKRDEDAKHTMQYLHALKNEFKQYSQLWVETNHAVSAYDEIKMCKSRTEAVDRQLEDAEEMLSNLLIPLYEVDQNMEQLQQQKAQAELNFIRTLGQLKYLAHLEKNKNVEECPVCKTLPQHKYAFLECGHHMCMTCYTMWSARKSMFNCVVCRYEQYKNKMYFVSISDFKHLTDSSSKVEQITRQVLELMKDDPAVKIVIFSQWAVILTNLEKAFAMNNISFRNNLHRFYESVREFKDASLGVTCLLLPITYGSKGLNLTEAQHVFFVEPILSPGDELQAIGRIHRIGQTKNTYVHRFIVKNTIEESIHKAIANDSTGLWASQKLTIDSLMELFTSTDIVVEAGQ